MRKRGPEAHAAAAGVRQRVLAALQAGRAVPADVVANDSGQGELPLS